MAYDISDAFLLVLVSEDIYKYRIFYMPGSGKNIYAIQNDFQNYLIRVMQPFMTFSCVAAKIVYLQ